MIYTYIAPLDPLAQPVAAPRVERHGVVYTKPWVVELMLDLAGYRASEDLVGALAVEPAAGDGSFLVPMVRRLLASCARQGRPPADCAASLVAYELDPESAALARRAVVRVLRDHGVAPGQAEELAGGWVRVGDYLLDAPGLPLADVVVGNPPYIRLEEMEAPTALRYRQAYRTMVGRADLYVAFFEAALKGLKPGGVCAFICADRWMLNQYGAELRRLVTAGYGVETVVEMHRADAFEREVSAYPAITVIRRRPQGAVVVASAGAAVERHGVATLVRSLRRTGAGDATVEGETGGETETPGLRATRVEGWFRDAEPWPCTSPERLALLKRLEAEFYPLESAGTATKVGIGVATGADDLFVTADPELVEPSRLLPLAMAADTAGGRLRWSGRYLVDPWDERGLVDLRKHPRLRAYFEAHRERLEGRHVGKRNAQGWYRTIDRVNHALTGQAKLYVPDVEDRLNPVLDRGEAYPHHNLYVVRSAVWDHEVLGGLLLSDVAQFFVECYGVRMRGGYLRFQAQYLRRIRVPRPQDVTVEQARRLADAFRRRDRDGATRTALAVYGIDRLPREEAGWRT
jgi:hypothetical protein